MLGLMWEKHLLFEGWTTRCRRNQRHDGERAFFKEKKKGSLVRGRWTEKRQMIDWSNW